MMRIPVTIYRGGTSKALFIKDYDLPAEPKLRDKVIAALFGSPDKRQIDGLGGADPLTSKLAIIGPPSRPDADVDYNFAQIDITSPTVHYGGVCGNISAAVGPYAIEEGFVYPKAGETTVRVYNRNIKRIISITVPTPDQTVQFAGDYAIDGVPGTGAKIELNWADTAGALTGAVLPTGNRTDYLEVPGLGSVEASLVDVGNPGLFVRAEDMGIKGTETPAEMDSDKALLDRCEAVTKVASDKLGHMAFLTLVAAPADYENHVTRKPAAAEDVDVLVRMIFMGQTHKAYAASQANCCGAAAMIPGTIVNSMARKNISVDGRVRLGHPAGVIEVEVDACIEGDTIRIPRIAVYRTARRLMDGFAFVRKEIFASM
ncbi:MAG: 3-methylitaconate isomerase [Desulfobacteraceae bacterium]|nr:MAG: 3-methylitaconate isomerase [Desulfobacteraceae bacterium]